MKARCIRQKINTDKDVLAAVGAVLFETSVAFNFRCQWFDSSHTQVKVHCFVPAVCHKDKH